MNGAILLLKHGANIEAQDEHVGHLASSRFFSYYSSLRLAWNAPVQSGVQFIVCHVGSVDLSRSEKSNSQWRWLHAEIDRVETNWRWTISFRTWKWRGVEQHRTQIRRWATFHPMAEKPVPAELSYVAWRIMQLSSDRLSLSLRV